MDTPNYQEVIGSTNWWRRCFSVNILNVYRSLPWLVFREEDLARRADDKLARDLVSIPITVRYDRNNIKHVQLYELLNSIYEEERAKRDTNLV